MQVVRGGLSEEVLCELRCERGVEVGQGKCRGRSVLDRRNSMCKDPEERKKLVWSGNWTERKSVYPEMRSDTAGPW